jgi:ABC-type multidrug transport system fused ATPase/permease subunit
MVRLPIFDTEFPVGIALLAWVAAVSFAIRLTSWLTFEVGGEWVMQGFHAKMMRGLRGTRTTYFDENPSGRIINRMVNDYEQLRTSCIVRIGDSIQALLEVLSIAAMVLIAQPLGGLLIVPTVAAFLYIQWGVSPMLQRLTTVRSIRLGEVIHRETDLIEGAKTFVLYGAERALLGRLHRAVSRYVQAHLLRVKIEGWGRVLSSAVTSFYSFMSILFVALAVRNESLTLVMGSAIVTIILRLTPACSWLAWSVSLLIESVGVTKRAFEVVDLPPQESEEFQSPREVSSVPLPASGALEFVSYSMSYRKDTPVIIREVTCSFAAGSKIGIVGRTGSGKTSLFQSLFRMVYVQEGEILFGGVPLLAVSLEDVRRLFGVVPQDPYLFSGTIRSNLDPDGVAEDSRLLSALAAVGITLPLDWAVGEGGKNLSVGERQLVCLARVIVYDRPIVLLDEPTSSVDNATDVRIQDALRTAFRDRTVVAIAHRLETLVNYDIVFEIQEGRIARSGTPSEILPLLSADDLA